MAFPEEDFHMPIAAHVIKGQLAERIAKWSLERNYVLTPTFSVKAETRPGPAPASPTLARGSVPGKPRALGILRERRLANWQPNIWDSNIIQSLRNDYNDLQWEPPKELKQAVQQMLETVTETVERLALIEDIQRLSVAYHFEQPTDNALSSLHLKKAEHLSKRDLQATSLYFRLLRQHGCYVSPG
ncbi:Trehalose-6-P synthase/phosphatase complex subunit [Asimina triloba]